MKNVLELINEIVTNGKNRGVGQFTTEDEFYDGRIITVEGTRLINFGSCSYLGLELDQRLKDGAIEAIKKYGVQFSCSRTYMSCTLYRELESLVRKIFDAPVVLSTSVSLGHHAVLPVVVGENDAIIMDQQVHASVQDAAIKMKAKGVFVTIVRHNDMDELRKKVSELSHSYNKVWYMMDGVYSMYGDFAPMDQIAEILKSHKKFHIYADDAHGLGWMGQHGRGYVLNQMNLHPKMIVATSLNKAFAAGGGAFVIPDEELCQKVRNCGGAFIFSGPHQIPVLGAGIASAKILLSDEIYEKQAALAEKINYCHELLMAHNLPVVSNPNTPIFFVGLGLVRVGYNLVKRMLGEGCFVNLSAFPAVPETCTGVRFTITLHHTKEDIEKLVKGLAYHFPRALEEEGRTINDVYRSFRRVANFKEKEEISIPSATSGFSIQYEQSISKIDKNLWNKLLGTEGIIDHESLELMEKSFSQNFEPENNWNFHYYIIRDKIGIPILATFFTTALTKDDMLAPPESSKIIESGRQKNKYFLTSKSLIMGTLLTEGKHMYLNQNHNEWRKALMLLLDTVWKLQDTEKAVVLNLRDFYKKNTDLYNFFKDQGFIPVPLPDTHVIENFNWKSADNFIDQVSSERRYYIKKKAQNFESLYDVNIITNPSENKIDEYYELYKNVASKSFVLNTFLLPKKLFQNMAKKNSWEFIELSMKGTGQPAGIAICHKSETEYCFLLTGMNYEFVDSHNLYPQILWQIVKRAGELNAPNVSLGFTASQNKRKFNATVIEKIGFVQMKDSFSVSFINTLAGGGKAA